MLIIQAAAVIVNVIIKRIHDDACHKHKPPARWLFVLMHYLKYPFLLLHIDYKKYITPLDDKAEVSDSKICFAKSVNRHMKEADKNGVTV